MASTTDARTIIDAAYIALDDARDVEWNDDELLTWLNLAQVELVNMSPRTNIKDTSMQLVAGIKQSLPADGILLLDVPYSRGSGNTGAGSTINEVSREFMNRRIPDWTTATASHITKRYIYNPEDPTTFYVYPPQIDTPGWVEIVYAAVPATIANANAGTKITVADRFRNILLNLVIAKALAKYSDMEGNAKKAQEYRALAELELGMTAKPQREQDATQEPAQKSKK
jgi:hypothetical protein